MANLMSKMQFAKSIGVDPAAITRATVEGASLFPACVGPSYRRRINLDHPSAMEYKRRAMERSAEAKKDFTLIEEHKVLYDAACRECGLCNDYRLEFIHRRLGVNIHKARIIRAEMVRNEVIPKGRESVDDELEAAVIKHAREEALKASQEVYNPTGPQVSTSEFTTEQLSRFGDLTINEFSVLYGSQVYFKDLMAGLKSIEILVEKRVNNAARLKSLVSRPLVMQGIVDPINTFHSQLLADGARTLAREITTLAETGATEEETEKAARRIIGNFLVTLKQKMKIALSEFQDEI